MFLRRERALTWPEVFARVRREFPDVRQSSGADVAGHPTHTVHPCDDRWRVLLREDLRELPA